MLLQRVAPIRPSPSRCALPPRRSLRYAQTKRTSLRGSRRRSVVPFQSRRRSRRAAADPSVSTSGAEDGGGDADSTEVFPRIRESDPYRVLGLSTDATFEEIQDARNYYYETYRRHEASREAIEVAFDRVLSEHMEKRKKFGFKAAKGATKKGAPADAAPRKSVVQRFLEFFEPSVPLPTIVNDGVIYLLLSLWAAGTQYATGDPSGPFVLALGFCAWRLFDKRQKRSPDGPFFGGNPIWGALGTTLLALLLGSFLAAGVVPLLPWPSKLLIDPLGACLIILVIGYISIFIK